MPFDPAAILNLGWRQGAVLGPVLLAKARELAPATVAVRDGDWLIVTSHDCDVVNERLDKEPVVEVLRGEVLTRSAADPQQAGGRNPRVLQLKVSTGAGDVVLACKVHERWTLPRDLLSLEAPTGVVPEKERRLVAEWLAKRYIRSAFPNSFDARWRSKLKDWTALLARHSEWIRGVYLRLTTLTELDAGVPYGCHLIVAVPAKLRKKPEWPSKREQLDREISAFWKQFSPGIRFDGVDVQGTDEVTLADIDPYQRFDADWVSFADDTPSTPMTADMSQ